MEGDSGVKDKLRPGLLALAIAIPVCVGGIAAMLTGDMMKEYFFLNKPPLSPPGWMFPVVWTILYVMMGLASYFVVTSGADRSLLPPRRFPSCGTSAARIFPTGGSSSGTGML